MNIEQRIEDCVALGKIAATDVAEFSAEHSMLCILNVVEMQTEIIRELYRMLPPRIQRIEVTSPGGVITSDASIRAAASVVHVVAGSDGWVPTEEEMKQLADLFAAACKDPLGSVVVTRPGVTAEVRQS